MDSAVTERQSLNILVTGADSALGLAIVRTLSRAGHKVTGITRHASKADLVRKSGGLPGYADLSRQSEIKSVMKMAKTDIVINAMTQYANHVPQKSAEWHTDTLLDTTTAILNAAAEVGVKFFVHTSYAFVYGAQDGAWVDETTRAHADEYDMLKAILRTEKAVLTADLPACVLRVGFVYSADSDELAALIDTVRRGLPVPSGKGYLNWVNADDAAEAVRRAAEAQPNGATYNIVDGTPTTADGFLLKLANALGINTPGKLPGFLAGLTVNEEQLTLMALSAKVRNAHAVQDLGWTPLYPDQARGIEDILLTWRAAETVR